MKEKYKEAQENVSSAKKLLEAAKIERGKPESSIMTEVELTLKKKSYHLHHIMAEISTESVVIGLLNMPKV